MRDVLQRLHMDVPYRTGPLAMTDLHAGGLFFCVIYRECLQFQSDGSVRRWCDVLDEQRAFDDEADQLRAIDMEGAFRLNERGYLSCVFPDLELTGLPSDLVPGLLAFHAWRKPLGIGYSLVYAAETAAS